MAKPNENKETPVVSEKVSLNEFCIRQSEKDKRVELIGAFEGVERKAGRVSDAPEAYAARFKSFINQPA